VATINELLAEELANTSIIATDGDGKSEVGIVPRRWPARQRPGLANRLSVRLLPRHVYTERVDLNASAEAVRSLITACLLEVGRIVPDVNDAPATVIRAVIPGRWTTHATVVDVDIRATNPGHTAVLVTGTGLRSLPNRRPAEAVVKDVVARLKSLFDSRDIHQR